MHLYGILSFAVVQRTVLLELDYCSLPTTTSTCRGHMTRKETALHGLNKVEATDLEKGDAGPFRSIAPGYQFIQR